MDDIYFSGPSSHVDGRPTSARSRTTTIELIFDRQSDGVDLAVGLRARFGIGYGLPHPELLPYIPEGRCCFWFGWGGAIVVNDLDRPMTFAYVMNKMGMSSPGGLGTERTKAYTKAAFSCCRRVASPAISM
jgi:hypothetical protein